MVNLLSFYIMLERLKKIRELIPFSNLVLDIGCDHGYLGLTLLAAKKTHFIWNVELHFAPLKQAQRSFRATNYFQHAAFYQSNGFLSLVDPGVEHTCICAGMGTKTILNIVNFAFPSTVTFVFLTHTLGYELRKWAAKLGLWVVGEAYVLEGDKVYELIIVSKKFLGKQIKYKSEADYLFGKPSFYKMPNNFTNFLSYWQMYYQKLQKIPPKHLKPWHKQQLKLIQKVLFPDE